MTAGAVLKDEPGTRVELVDDGDRQLVCKTYRNRGLRLLQTFGRRSRAAREYRNLLAVATAGVPCTAPVDCSERGGFGFVLESTLRTVFAPDCTPVKQVLAGLPAAARWRERRWLIAQMAEKLARLHRQGLLWCTAMPRNFLLQGAPLQGRLLLVDAPALIRVGRSIHGRALAAIDLYDAVLSPSRQLEFSRPERFRYLLAYAAGDRALARRLWAIGRRSRQGHRLRRNLTMLWCTYFLAPWRSGKTGGRPGSA